MLACWDFGLAACFKVICSNKKWQKQKDGDTRKFARQDCDNRDRCESGSV